MVYISSSFCCGLHSSECPELLGFQTIQAMEKSSGRVPWYGSRTENCTGTNHHYILRGN
jgi:hypothetical protein